MARTNKSSEKIVDAFIALVRRKGYSEVSVSDITRDAGVSRITFYRNFSSREDVMSRFIERVVSEVEEAVRAMSAECRLQEYMEAVFRCVLPYSDVIRELSAAHVGELIQQFCDRYLFATLIRNGRFPAEPYEKRFLAGGVCNVMISWIRSGAQESPAQLARVCSSMMYEKGILGS